MRGRIPERNHSNARSAIKGKQTDKQTNKQTNKQTLDLNYVLLVECPVKLCYQVLIPFSRLISKPVTGGGWNGRVPPPTF